MKIYLDVCCLNRAFDDLGQERIKLEAEAINYIINQCQAEKWILINSDAIEFEMSKNSDSFKTEQVATILSLAKIYINSNQAIEDRAKELITFSFKFYDALHLAFAEYILADVMLTTDDRLCRKAKQYKNKLNILVDNPVTWLMTIFQSQEDN